MSDLAQRLRETRVSLGFSLAQAEQATKIRGRYLDAIETGDFVRLPDGLSARGFVKNYARWLGLDFTQALVDFESEWGVLALNAGETIPNPPSRERMRSRYTEIVKLPEQHYTGTLPSDDAIELDALGQTIDDDAPRPLVNLGDRPPRVDANGRPIVVIDERRDFSKSPNSFRLGVPKTKHIGGLVDGISTFIPGDGLNTINSRGRTKSGNIGNGQSPQRRNTVASSLRFPLPSRNLLFGVAGILCAVLVIYGITTTLTPAIRGLTAGGRSTATPIFNTTADPEARATALSPENASLPPVAGPQSVGGTLAPPPPLPKIEGGGIQLTLDARERAWIRVRVDGKQVFEGIAPIGPNSSWRAASSVSIETGNAGAFEVIVNGTRLGAIGTRNSVARLTYDLSGATQPFVP